ncbi:hypothetical protein MLD38_002824 [Melastoma candidum]|uniref:Uncharacterized protein n=1 Tax=Melastoma candidum TaxID=119954 RepID=A0ACB9RZU5_9MYRT|nr:hypothetical protein MLD38_002824 [Melastoma candidum]
MELSLSHSFASPKPGCPFSSRPRRPLLVVANRSFLRRTRGGDLPPLGEFERRLCLRGCSSLNRLPPRFEGFLFPCSHILTLFTRAKLMLLSSKLSLGFFLVVVQKDSPKGTHFLRAGPREKVYFTPEEVRACIVTCGGLCPGIYTVIREIVCGLNYMYGVDDVLRIEVVMVHRGAALIYKEVEKCGLQVAVAGIPKTIDNYIAICMHPSRHACIPIHLTIKVEQNGMTTDAKRTTGNEEGGRSP